MKKNNPDHPFHRHSGGSVGAEARQENREVGEAPRRPVPADRLPGDCGAEEAIMNAEKNNYKIKILVV